MNKVKTILGLAFVCILSGCASAPVALSSVGPNPYALPDGSQNGQLEVFSALVGRIEGDNPTWFQHTDYRILTPQHGLVKRVDNTVGYYAESPRIIALPAGTYLVEAQAKDYFLVEVPVVIQTGKLTVVHLDNNWSPSPGTSRELVKYAPNGWPIGWSADQTGRTNE